MKTNRKLAAMKNEHLNCRSFGHTWTVVYTGRKPSWGYLLELRYALPTTAMPAPSPRKEEGTGTDNHGGYPWTHS